MVYESKIKKSSRLSLKGTIKQMKIVSTKEIRRGNLDVDWTSPTGPVAPLFPGWYVTSIMWKGGIN